MLPQWDPSRQQSDGLRTPPARCLRVECCAGRCTLKEGHGESTMLLWRWGTRCTPSEATAPGRTMRRCDRLMCMSSTQVSGEHQSGLVWKTITILGRCSGSVTHLLLPLSLYCIVCNNPPPPSVVNHLFTGFTTYSLYRCREKNCWLFEMETRPPQLLLFLLYIRSRHFALCFPVFDVFDFTADSAALRLLF